MTLKEKWKLLKANLDHKDAFLDIHTALTGGSAGGSAPDGQLAPQGEVKGAPSGDPGSPQANTASPGDPSQAPQEQAPPEMDAPAEEAPPSPPSMPATPPPAEGGPPTGPQMTGGGDGPAPEEEAPVEAPPKEEEAPELPNEDPEAKEAPSEQEQNDLLSAPASEESEEELIEALKQLGHTDSEIAHIVHGHSLSHAVTFLKEKIQEDFEALKEHQDLNHKGKMSEIELAHKQRMLDAEHESVDPKHEGKVRDLEFEHKKRMLDLEHSHATRIKDLEFEQKKKAGIKPPAAAKK